MYASTLAPCPPAALAFRITGLLLLLTVSTAWGQPAPRAYNTPTVHFSTSCDPAVAATFDRALELLHSFEYPESEELFRVVLEADPDCAMARWGSAMTRWHPLWAPPTAVELQEGAALLEGADLSAASPRERTLIEALARFFSDADPTSHDERAAAYGQAMARLHRQYPDDVELATFHALALLAIADPADPSQRVQRQTASVLGPVLRRQPDHPGALHYLIHSYDHPRLAHLALDAAEQYAAIAPDSAHAQHMPSHIFTRLGLWQRAIASNRDASAAATAYTARAHLTGHYDEGIHSIDYLVYALLQVADDQAAAAQIERLRSLGPAEPQSFKVAYAYAASPARYALERRAWDEAAHLELIDPGFPWSRYEWARSIHHFARGIGAARSGATDLAHRELDALQRIADGLAPETLPYWREQVLVHGDAVASWIAHAEGDDKAALRLARVAAEREDGVDKHPVTPGEVLPARELYADLLLELGRARQAREQYELVLRRAPNRTNALLGATEAADRSNDRAAAVGYYRKALAQTMPHQQQRARLRAAEAYLKRESER